MPDQQPTDSLVERSRWSTWVIVAVIVLLAYVVLRLPLFPSSTPEQPPVELPLPALELQGFTGTDQSLTLEDLQGHVTLLNFWATWCGPCRLEFPQLLDLQDRFHDRPEFRLLSIVSGVRADSNLAQSRDEVSAFLKKLDAKVPTYIDPRETTHRAVLELLASQTPGSNPSAQSFSLPTTLLVDRRGIVRNVWVGFAPNVPGEIGQRVARLLEEK